MKLLNRVERVTLNVPGGRSIEALVRVWGVDARSPAGGLMQRRQEPIAIDAGPDRGMIDIPRATFGPPAWVFVAIPIASYAMRFAFRKGAR